MYDNIGKKIKLLARIITIIAVIASIIAGIILMALEQYWGIIFIILFPFVLWVSSFILYGFGELIDNTCDIERNIGRGIYKSAVQIKQDDKKNKMLEKLRSEGLISEEEYREKISEEK